MGNLFGLGQAYLHPQLPNSPYYLFTHSKGSADSYLVVFLAVYSRYTQLSKGKSDFGFYERALDMRW